MSAVAVAPFNSVVDLTTKRLDKVNDELRKPNAVRGFAAWCIDYLEAIPVYFLSRLSSSLTDDAIWFRGLAQEISTENLDVRPLLQMAKMHERLDKIKADLRKLREGMLDTQQKSPKQSALYESAAKVASSATDLFDAIESLRLCLVEQEANFSAIDEGYSASSPEELASLFARLKQEA